MNDLDQRPGNHECFDYHRDYVALVPDGSIVETLEAQLESMPAFIRGIPTDQIEVIHSPYQWRIRTVFEHCCDAERIFGYRALRFATGEKNELHGWDEKAFVTSKYCRKRDIAVLAEEIAALRTANLSLIKRLAPDRFDQIGIADGRKLSVRAIAWLMAGHWIHHESIVSQRLGH